MPHGSRLQSYLGLCEGSNLLRLNPHINSFAPGNRNSVHTTSNIVDPFSSYPRVQLQLILDRFELYLDHHALSPATVRNYVADLRAFARWHAARNARPQTFSASDFRAYREHLCNETKHSRATVNRRLQSLRLFGRFLHEIGHAADNPTREIQLLPNGNGHHPTPRTLTRAEIERLAESICAGRPSLVPRDHAILWLMVHTGLRVHEVAAIRLNDIVTTRQGISVRVRGRGGERVVPLNSVAARALRDYLPTRPAIPRVEHLFLSQRGLPLSTRSVQRLIENYARAAGLKDVCAQTLRHTYAKNQLEETRDATQVALWLGCSAKSLERYGAGRQINK
jgi:site-specific recombinase XerD